MAVTGSPQSSAGAGRTGSLLPRSGPWNARESNPVDPSDMGRVPSLVRIPYVPWLILFLPGPSRVPEDDLKVLPDGKRSKTIFLCTPGSPGIPLHGRGGKSRKFCVDQGGSSLDILDILELLELWVRQFIARTDVLIRSSVSTLRAKSISSLVANSV